MYTNYQYFCYTNAQEMNSSYIFYPHILIGITYSCAQLLVFAPNFPNVYCICYRIQCEYDDGNLILAFIFVYSNTIILISYYTKYDLIGFWFPGGQNVRRRSDDFLDLLVALSLVFRVRVPQQGHSGQSVRARPVPELLLVGHVQFDGEPGNLLLDEPEVGAGHMIAVRPPVRLFADKIQCVL